MTGWAADRDDAIPVQVQIVVDDRVAATLTADDFRPDLAQLGAGIGGAHGFDTIVALAPGAIAQRVCVNTFDNGVNAVAIGCRAL